MNISSDFQDYYDAALIALDDASIPAGTVLHRYRLGSLPRSRGFAILQQLGWPLVPHGRVEDVCRTLRPEHRVVIYSNPFMHGPTADGADALVLATRDDALRNWPGSYCSLYALNSDQEGHVVSFTQVVVGTRRFEVLFRQREAIGTAPYAWASNRGTYEAHVIRELPSPGFDPIVRLPVWSVDFVWVEHLPGHPELPTAFDFNAAPILATMGLQHALDADTVAALIGDACKHYEGAEGTGISPAIGTKSRATEEDEMDNEQDEGGHSDVEGMEDMEEEPGRTDAGSTGED